jgi:membrane associated rhomboid family serine protease
MDYPLRELGRALLILGAASAIVGALFFFGARLPFRLGRLPGDIIYRGEHTTIYFPIVTCLVISVVLSILFGLFSNFRR